MVRISHGQKRIPESNSIFYKDFYKDLFGKDFKISRFKKIKYRIEKLKQLY